MTNKLFNKLNSGRSKSFKVQQECSETDTCQCQCKTSSPLPEYTPNLSYDPQFDLGPNSSLACKQNIENFSLSSKPKVTISNCPPAVEFDNVTFKHAPNVTILDSIRLIVPRGCIFGLLGPSSCGKTTLLRCLVGLLRPQAGNIRVFGKDTRLDARTCKVPGSNVGYMPQELGLYDDFTIEQQLTMFGRYNSMPPDLIAERIDFLTTMLDLPDKQSVIAQLSGGQRRRVSFAVSCLNLPPLIILDEPTVGVDPLLRQSIWHYLIQLAHQYNRTIIITTHYIEEAARADQVALMRKGRLLLQDPPRVIMNQFGVDTLEQAFLRVCYDAKISNAQSKSYRSQLELASVAKSESLTNLIGKMPNDLIGVSQQQYINYDARTDTNITRDNDKSENPWTLSLNTKETPERKSKTFFERFEKLVRLMMALIYKNFRRNFNSIPLVAFQFMLPIIQIVSFVLSVGGRPFDIGLGIVNYETLPISIHTNGSLDDPGSYLSSIFLTHIDRTMLSPRYYQNLGDAIADVRQAKIWAAMEIGNNFSDLLSNRFDSDLFYEVDTPVILGSTIRLYPDRSNQIIDTLMLRSITESYRSFLVNEFEDFSRLPLKIGTPVFEIKSNSWIKSVDGYTESIAAGLLASITYIMATGLTTFIMIVERHSGILERTFTTGINPAVYLLAHAIFRSLVMMAQIFVIFFVTFIILAQPLEGSVVTAYLLLLLLNCTGVAYGLMISSMTRDQHGAALTVVSSLVVQVTMSGILWPIKAIPWWLRIPCYIQPLTMPVQALKNITLKGLGFEDMSVVLGFVTSFAWLIVFLVVASKKFKFYQ